MSNNRLVYSTDAGRICVECQKPSSSCICEERAAHAVRGDGNVKLRREVKGRAGKSVVVISGLPLNQLQLKELLGKLKRLCGAGGTVKDGLLEVQGEHLDKIREVLQREGYKPKG